LAFLCPPSATLRSAALDDFGYATQLREVDVVQYLFVTTDYFLTHRNGMPQLAQLKTFREPRAQLAGASNQFYFRWWNLISFRLWSIIYLLLLLMALFINTKLQANDGVVILYAVVLCIFVITMVLLNCFFAAIQPRFALPMIELLILSMMILLAMIFRGVQDLREMMGRRNQLFRRLV